MFMEHHNYAPLPGDCLQIQKTVEISKTPYRNK